MIHKLGSFYCQIIPGRIRKIYTICTAWAFAITRILSLREIRGEHIPLLQSMLVTGCKAIEDKYGLQTQQTRAFLHYQPSFYHLHVHYTNLVCNVPQARVERAHLLQDVINNLKSDPDYYQRKTLHYKVINTDEIALALNLWKCFMLYSRVCKLIPSQNGF